VKLILSQLGKKISHILRSLQVSYVIHNSQSMELISSQMTRIQILSPYLFKIHFNIIFPSSPTFFPSSREGKWDDKINDES
jgi:hypothetical protein